MFNETTKSRALYLRTKIRNPRSKVQIIKIGNDDFNQLTARITPRPKK